MLEKIKFQTRNRDQIGIAEKSQETRRDRWGGNVNHNLTLPPQQSLLVSWLFSAIPI